MSINALGRGRNNKIRVDRDRCLTIRSFTTIMTTRIGHFAIGNGLNKCNKQDSTVKRFQLNKVLFISLTTTCRYEGNNAGAGRWSGYGSVVSFGLFLRFGSSFGWWMGLRPSTVAPRKKGLVPTLHQQR